MSVRSNPRSTAPVGSSSAAIEFKQEFTNSATAIASNDEAVSHILSRLDQLQSKITDQPETAAAPRAPRAAGDVHSRLSTLESIHEDALHRLSSKLDTLERQLSNNKEAEALMGKISTKFGAIENQLSAQKDAEALMSKIASKFTQVESRLQSATKLCDRVETLESRLSSDSDLHRRIQTLEAQLKPDPEQARILTRINSKLTELERNGRPAPPEREERVKFLQTRIEKLKELRSRYQEDDLA